ncbi:MAG: hypothetical protein ABEJ02_00850, partial [Candidatus Paceibacteria bacterium]
KTEERSVTLEDIKNMEFGEVEAETPDDPYQLVELMKQMKDELIDNGLSESKFDMAGKEANTLQQEAQQEVFAELSESAQGEGDDLLKSKYKKLQDKLMKIFAEREDLPLHKEDLESETETEEGESGPEEGTETGEKGEGNEEFDEQEALKKFAELYDEKKKIEDQKELDESQKAKIEKIRDALQGLLGELKNNTEMSRDEIMEEISKHSEELRAVEGGDLTDEEEAGLEEDVENAIKEQRDIIHIDHELFLDVLDEQELYEKIVPELKQALKKGDFETMKEAGKEAEESAVSHVESMFKNMDEEQKDVLKDILAEHGLELEDFDWEEQLAEDVVQQIFEEQMDNVQKQVEESIGAWDKFTAGLKENAIKAGGALGLGYLAGEATSFFGGGETASWISRVTGIRVGAESFGSISAEEDTKRNLEQKKADRREEIVDQVFEDMEANPEQSKQLLARLMSTKLRDVTAAEKVKNELGEVTDDEDVHTIIDEHIDHSTFKSRKERMLYDYSQELQEAGLEQEAIQKKYELLEAQLEDFYSEKQNVIEAAVEEGASKEVLENLVDEFEGQLPQEVVEDMDSETKESLKENFLALLAGGSGLTAVAADLPVVGGMAVGAETGRRIGGSWEQSAQKEHIAKQKAQELQKDAVVLLNKIDSGDTIDEIEEVINSSDLEVELEMESEEVGIEDIIARLEGGLKKGVFDRRKINSQEKGLWEKMNSSISDVLGGKTEAADMNTAFLETRVESLVHELDKKTEERTKVEEEESKTEVQEFSEDMVDVPIDSAKTYEIQKKHGPDEVVRNFKINPEENEVEYDTVTDPGEEKNKTLSLEEFEDRFKRDGWKFNELDLDQLKDNQMELLADNSGEGLDAEEVPKIQEYEENEEKKDQLLASFYMNMDRGNKNDYVSSEVVDESYQGEHIDGVEQKTGEINLVPDWVGNAENLSNLLESEDLSEEEEMVLSGIQDNLEEGVFDDMKPKDIRRNLESYNFSEQMKDKIADIIVKETQEARELTELENKMTGLVERLDEQQQQAEESGKEQINKIKEETSGWRKPFSVLAGMGYGALWVLLPQKQFQQQKKVLVAEGDKLLQKLESQLPQRMSMKAVHRTKKLGPPQRK